MGKMSTQENIFDMDIADIHFWDFLAGKINLIKIQFALILLL